MNDGAPKLAPAAGPQTAREIHETLYDGADVKVRHLDGSTEMVKVRRIPRNEFAAFSLLFGHVGQSESAECAFYVAGKDEAWAETLDDDSYDLVLEEGQRLNFTRFVSWFKRQSRKLALADENDSMIQKAMAILDKNPDLLTRPGSMNGSSPRDTAKAISGNTRSPS